MMLKDGPRVDKIGQGVMMKNNIPSRSLWPAVLSLVWVGVSPSPIRAEVLSNVAFGLGYAGFDISGTNNPLSGGYDFLVTNTFIGNELDFGPSDLTLRGPISVALSTGGRAFTEIELAFRTATDASAQAVPLAYDLNYDVGSQRENVSGSIFLDGLLKVNSFGYYDLTFEYSSRQTVTGEGRFDNSSTNLDYDLGPIRVRGNIVADVLAAVTEPFFEAAGAENPFAQFSASANLKALLEERTATVIGSPSEGNALAADEVAQRVNNAVINEVLGAAFRGLLTQGIAQEPSSGRGLSVVPEPTVLLLMLLGIPMVLHHGLRHFRRGGAKPAR